MISRLLNEVVASAGVEIRTSGDCHTLSEIVAARTGKVVNYNTLRRMYGLAKPVKPNRGSLDILSQFVGFDSYVHFISGAPRLYSTRTKEQVYLLFAEGKDSQAVQLLSSMPESTVRSDLIIQLCRESFVSGDTNRALSLLEKTEPLLDKLPYSEVVHVGNSIGIARSTLTSFSGSINHHPYQRVVHSLFVDYPNLSGYYGAEVDALDAGRAHAPEFQLFVECVRALRCFLRAHAPHAERSPHSSRLFVSHDACEHGVGALVGRSVGPHGVPHEPSSRPSPTTQARWMVSGRTPRSTNPKT